ncbi:hypothetical protein G6F65_017553 [Rhizopus arrhizus]|nr:hypothetical protein G6F65_017553 [Rhizopus arrhizus]
MPQTWLAQRTYSSTSRAPEVGPAGSAASASSFRMIASARWADSHWQKYGTADWPAYLASTWRAPCVQEDPSSCRSTGAVATALRLLNNVAIPHLPESRMPSTATSNPSIRRVAIVGAGTIGASWAALFLAHGLEVVVSDPASDAAALTRARVQAAWPVLKELGRVADGASPDALRFEPDLTAALAGVDFVQENAPEREDFKIDLFARMDAILPPHVIVASSSSGLIMSRLQSRCRHAGPSPSTRRWASIPSA